jgi:hypothetical protein
MVSVSDDYGTAVSGEDTWIRSGHLAGFVQGPILQIAPLHSHRLCTPEHRSIGSPTMGRLEARGFDALGGVVPNHMLDDLRQGGPR